MDIVELLRLILLAWVIALFFAFLSGGSPKKEKHENLRNDQGEPR